MDPEAKGDVIARVAPLDDKIIGVLEHILVAVSRDIPHHYFFALLDLLAGNLGIDQCGPAHVGERRLPADSFADEVLDELTIFAKFFVLVGEEIEGVNAAGKRIARRVVAADDQQDKVAEEVLWIHVPRARGLVAI